MTFLALAPEHPYVFALTKPQQKTDIESYITNLSAKKQLYRQEMPDEKSGVFTGSYAIHPITGNRLPIWVSDYIVIGYGSGAIMGVPAHDERDFKFARSFGLSIVQVVCPDGMVRNETQVDAAYTGEGTLVRSGSFSGMHSSEARTQIIRRLIQQRIGKAQVRYRLHDWCISRQRYWGAPIPIIYCDHCGAVPVPEKDLPVRLSFLESYEPDGSGKSPLALDPDFFYTRCPRCHRSAKRETDVMDNFVDSAWYFLRYPSSHLNDKAFDEQLTEKWLPVDMYVGGNEHAVRHLLYTRFITMVLHDLGLVSFQEPFKKFRAHGIIVKDGMKMSKSKGNVVNPDEYLRMYGADVLRTYLMFAGDFRQGGDFRDQNIVGIQRFLNRLNWHVSQTVLADDQAPDRIMLKLMHKTIQRVTEDIENLHYNTAIAAIMEFFQGLVENGVNDRECFRALLKLLAPFAPFITHELWERVGGKGMLCEQEWPLYDSSLVVDEAIEFVIQVNGKVRKKAMLEPDATKERLEQIAFSSQRIQAHIRDKSIHRTIFVPGKLLNIVAGD